VVESTPGAAGAGYRLERGTQINFVVGKKHYFIVFADRVSEVFT